MVLHVSESWRDRLVSSAVATVFRSVLHTRMMTLRIDLGVAELAATRFAISPLSETVSALQQLAGRQRQASNLPWLRWATDELAGDPLDLPATWPLVANVRASWPEFLVPAPVGTESSIIDDLEALQRTSAGQVRASLRRVFGESLPENVASLAARPIAGLSAIATELHAAHDRLIAPHWSRIRAVLDADVSYRAKHLVAGGAEKLFADLHSDLHWRDGRLILQRPRGQSERPVCLGPRGLVLIPVVLCPPEVLIKKSTSTQTTVRYPARGIGSLWTAGNQTPAASTIRLLGRVRTELLETLRSPATTGDLARMFGVTPSAVSQHLRVLRDCGLVARERSGRNVRYVVTALGIRLLSEQPDRGHQRRI
ncbi:ArsR/SmtB family transcription factor [Nocardia sp. CA-128927]|uniref:ArsR/SmtB family transcription factor n=1 Tax=Nocardia sp. CA-128927 TaxID=3239975 RepID=UPI003D984542